MQVSSDNISQKGKFRFAERSYAESLRLIGQVLLKFRPKNLEIQLVGGVYHVRGMTAGISQKSFSISPKTAKQKLAAKSFFRRASSTTRSSSESFALSYTPEEIAKLGKEWKTKRHEVGKIPDIHGVAELLRTIGSDLDSSGSSLLKITREGRKLVVQFQERDGKIGTREYDLVFLSGKQKEVASDRLSRAALIPWKDWDL
jgi:hypothetical protein